eukprot:1279679-Prorocentrum_lima.AAC.1
MPQLHLKRKDLLLPHSNCHKLRALMLLQRSTLYCKSRLVLFGVGFHSSVAASPTAAKPTGIVRLSA